MGQKKQAPAIVDVFCDDGLPVRHRVKLLHQTLMNGDDDGMEAVGALLKRAASAGGADRYRRKVAQLDRTLAQLSDGPLRPAIFQDVSSRTGSVPRGRVILEDGSTGYVTIPEPKLAKQLVRGDRVLVDAQGKALLFRDDGGPDIGEQARLERHLGDGRIEVVVRDHERLILLAAQQLTAEIEEGRVQPGRALLICARRRVAFQALPEEDGLSHYRFLAREPVPDVVLERDVGAPPAYIEEVVERVRMELESPELCRRYELHRCVTRLLVGPSGTGKTHSIQALWRRLYELMSSRTGVSIDGLPPRVLRLRMSQVLSHWLGDSDKNLDRFFDEVEQVAAEPFVDPDGRTHVLPTLVILEEIDGLARSRGQEPVYDRILTTALQRLDTSRRSLNEQLVVFIATTNVAEQVDPAFLRRVGGSVEHFGRLQRQAFAAVLEKQLGDRPVATTNGDDPDEARRRLIAELTADLYRPRHADRGQVELHYAGSSTPEVRYRRDFLSGALVQMALQQAAMTSCLADLRGGGTGLTRAAVLRALDRQVRGIVDRLQVGNVHDYTDVPIGQRVARLRHLPRPEMEAIDLEGVA